MSGSSRRIGSMVGGSAGMRQLREGCANQESLLRYAIQMERDGRAEDTILEASRILRRLSKECDLSQPEEVKAILAKKNWMSSTKRHTVKVLSSFYKFMQIQWTPPNYKAEESLPFIPTEAEIDILISAGRAKTTAMLQLLKETGMRHGEIFFLRWTDIDVERKTIHITPEKGSKARILPVSDKLIGMLLMLPRETERVFNIGKHSSRVAFEKLRNRIAKKLQNPRLKEIHLHTFRHWKGTMEYHKSKDVYHVMKVLGHKNIDSTMTYINIEQAIFLTTSDEWTCFVAHNEKELMEAICSGFELVTETHGDFPKYFRKRK